jgi:transcriptional regulator with XRE-family HTH domain
MTRPVHRTTTYDHRRLKAARIAAGLTLEQASAAAFCSVGTIEVYERGSVPPTVRTLGLLAQAYGVDVDELYDAADPDDVVTHYQAYLDALVAKAPPLTAEQRTKLAVLLRRSPS